MKKALKIKITIGTTVTLFAIAILIFTLIYDWSWWWLASVVIIPIMISLGITIVMKIKSEPKKETTDEVKSIPIKKVLEKVNKWMKDPENPGADLVIKEPQIEIYTPAQTGENKSSYYKIKVDRGWGKDILFISTPINKLDFTQRAYNPKTDEDFAYNEKDFEERIDKAVANPEKMTVVESRIEDPTTGRISVNIKKAPTDYLERYKEKKQAEEHEEEEGAKE